MGAASDALARPCLTWFPFRVGSPAAGRYHPAVDRDRENASPKVTWTFITSHGLVLLAIAQNPTSRLRDIASRVGITERAVQRIVADLIDAGYLSKTRQGRRNVYALHENVHLPHATTRHQEIGALLETLMSSPGLSSG
jgi:MarR family protein